VNIRKVTVIKWMALLALVLVQLATIVLLKNTERFYVEKQQLLQDPEFVNGPAFWRQDGAGDVLHNGKAISIVNDRTGHQSIFQTLPIDRPGHYTISFDAAMNSVKGVASNYGRAEVLVIYRDQQGSTYGAGKKLFAVAGSRPMTPYSYTLYLAGNIESVDFAMRLNNASGRFTVVNPVFSRLQEFPFYKKVKVVLSVLWGLIFVGLAITAWRNFSRSHALILGAALGIAVVGVLLPENIMTSLYGTIGIVVPTSLLSAVSQTLTGLFGYTSLGGSGAEVGKLGHFGVFLVLGFIAGANFRKIGLVFSIAGLAAFASLTEVLQLLVIGRTASINDFFVDFTAGVLGLTAGVFVYLFFGKQAEQSDFAAVK